MTLHCQRRRTLSCRSTAAPRESRNETISARPAVAALCKGGSPSCKARRRGEKGVSGWPLAFLLQRELTAAHEQTGRAKTHVVAAPDGRPRVNKEDCGVHAA